MNKEFDILTSKALSDISRSKKKYDLSKFNNFLLIFFLNTDLFLSDLKVLLIPRCMFYFLSITKLLDVAILFPDNSKNDQKTFNILMNAYTQTYFHV